MRTLALTFLLALPLTACGGTPQRAAMPDVASTDQSADDMGLPSAETAQDPTTATSDETTTEQLETVAE